MKDYKCPECSWQGKQADAHLVSSDIAFYMCCPECGEEFEEIDLSEVRVGYYDETQLPEVPE